MCVAFLALDQHPDWPLIVAVNRDEWHARPTRPVQWWDDAPLLAGRDERSGGTWLGVTPQGRWGLITNFRDPAAHRAQQRSRGRLITDFLCGTADATTQCAQILPHLDHYNGFNVLLADAPTQVRYCSSRLGTHRALDAGLYGLSNAHLNTPWPKIVRGTALFRHALQSRGDDVLHAAMTLLDDRATAADTDLPQTGVSLERERLLSAICIVSPTYGTRNSSVLAFRPDGRGVLWSADRDVDGALGTIAQFIIGQ